MKKRRKWRTFVLSCAALLTAIQVNAVNERTDFVTTDSLGMYEKILETYKTGDKMEGWIVEERKKAARELGVTDYLDEKYFLNADYRNAHFGKGSEITDLKTEILIERTSEAEYEEMVMVLQSGAGFLFAAGDTVGVTQQAKLSGAGNGYFSVAGAASWGYCCQNSKNFWNNGVTKNAKVTEWNQDTVRKVLFFAPGGPGYTGPYYGSVGADTDYATFAVGKLNGDTANNTKAAAFIQYVSNRTDAREGNYKVFRADVTPDTYQDVAFLVYEPPAPPKGKLSLQKTSKNPNLTEGNSCYSLAGAKYGVYISANAAGAEATLTTNEKGISNVVELNAGTYYVKETAAPKGYVLDPTVYTVTVAAGQTKKLEVSDFPKFAKADMLLEKVDAETNKNIPYGSLKLEGAQFTVKYYGGVWEKDTDPAELGESPLRSWVFKTDEEGHCEYSEKDFVSGDDFYFDTEGNPILPIGTISIRETKPPEGYLLNRELYIVPITTEGTGGNVSAYNMPVIPENILKLNLLKRQEGTDIVIPGAMFEHTMPDGKKEVLSTDENGEVSVKGLLYGKHILRELSVMDGYLINGNEIIFTVAENNSIELISSIDDSLGKVTFEVTEEGNIRVMMEDKLVPFQLIIHKENHKKKEIPGAEFTLYSDRACMRQVAQGITDKAGILKIENLQAGTSYYLKETKAAAGYKIPLDAEGNPVVYEISVETVPAQDIGILSVNGQVYDLDSLTDGMLAVTGTKANREVHMTVLNEEGIRLPNTGSFGTICFIFGTILAGTALVISFRKKEKEKK